MFIRIDVGWLHTRTGNLGVKIMCHIKGFFMLSKSVKVESVSTAKLFLASFHCGLQTYFPGCELTEDNEEANCCHYSLRQHCVPK